jgi:uncharacterized membrane protein YgcG
MCDDVHWSNMHQGDPILQVLTHFASQGRLLHQSQDTSPQSAKPAAAAIATVHLCFATGVPLQCALCTADQANVQVALQQYASARHSRWVHLSVGSYSSRQTACTGRSRGHSGSAGRRSCCGSSCRKCRGWGTVGPASIGCGRR